MIVFTVITALIVAADRIAKYFAAVNLQPEGSIPVISGVFSFTYAENTGAAFSIFEGQRWILVSVAALALLAIIYIVASKKITDKLGVLSLAFISGGALGNLIDRAYYGYVVDMLEFKFIKFAIFNVADSFLTVGSIMLGIYILFFYGKKSGNGNENTSKDI